MTNWMAQARMNQGSPNIVGYSSSLTPGREWEQVLVVQALSDAIWVFLQAHNKTTGASFSQVSSALFEVVNRLNREAFERTL